MKVQKWVIYQHISFNIAYGRICCFIRLQIWPRHPMSACWKNAALQTVPKLATGGPSPDSSLCPYHLSQDPSRKPGCVPARWGARRQQRSRGCCRPSHARAATVIMLPKQHQGTNCFILVIILFWLLNWLVCGGVAAAVHWSSSSLWWLACASPHRGRVSLACSTTDSSVIGAACRN